MNCKACFSEHDGSFGSGRFCNRSCSNSFSGQKTEAIKKKISDALKGPRIKAECKLCWLCNKEFLTRKRKKHFCNITCQNRYRSRKAGKKVNRLYPQNIAELHHQTLAKLVRRMKLECSNCKWNLSACDVHHINGKKIENANSHENLSYLCPNCHRLVHRGILLKSDIVTLEQQIGDSWKEFYYG